jgi:hypothetical protein
MRRRWAWAAVVLATLAACGGDDPSTVEPASTTATTTAAPTSTASDGTCPDTYPPFGTTWLPEEWKDDYLVAGSGGDDTEQCGVYHWGGDGRYIDVRLGDGAQSFGAGTRTITVLGRPTPIGPIHEGFMVRTDTHALLAYGVTEDVLQRVAEGLYASPRRSFDEAPLPPDGIGPARIVSIDEHTVTVDPIAWYVGDAAKQALVDHGFTEDDLTNDYFAPNDDTATQTLPVGADVVVTSPWAEYGSGGCELCQRVIGFDRLRAIVGGPEPDGPTANVRHDPFWITVAGGVVTRLDEQYVP